jgi:pimeloyl-ACP methyl ester carboxylesterase
MKYFVALGEHRRLDATSRQQLRGSFLKLSDGVTHYELSGPADGDLVVLIGGLTIPLFYWDAMARELHTLGLRTLAYSCYGRGYSDRVRSGYDESLFVRQLAGLARELRIGSRFHLVGTSMGALIAMAYAAQHADTLATLTFAGPAGLAEKPALPPWLMHSDRMATFVAKWFGSRILRAHLGHNVQDPGRADELATMVLDAYQYEGSLFALFSTLQRVSFVDRTELFGAMQTLNVPKLLLWGDNDRVTPITQMDRARQLIQPQQTHVVRNCGHMAPYERPAEVSKTIAAWVASCTQRPSCDATPAG